MHEVGVITPPSPPLSFSLPTPPSLTSVSAVPLFLSHPLAGWRDTHTHAFLLYSALLYSLPLPLTCCLAHFSLCPPLTPSRAATAPLEQLMCLLPLCFTAIALPQFPYLHCSSCFLLPDNHGRVGKPHYRKTGRGRRERRGRPAHSSFQLLHSSVCPSQAVISCTLWTHYWEQLVGRELPEGIHLHKCFHILFFSGTECRGQKREGLRAGLQLRPCPKNTQIFPRLDSGDTLIMASVDRNVSGWLRSEDLLHTGLIVALLLGEFVSSSTLSLLTDALFPNSSVSLSFFSFLLFIPYVLLSFF